MHKLQSASTFLFVALFPLSSDTLLADTEFEDSIPVDTVKALFNSYHDDQFAVYSDIAEAFPDFPVPAGFTVVGSVFQTTALRVVFATDLNEVDAVQSFVSGFEAQNWIQFPSFSPPTQEVGFVSSRQFNPARSRILCHDNLGHITIRYSAGDSSNYLSASIDFVTNGQQGNCEQQIVMRQSSSAQTSQHFRLEQYLPRMEMPESQNRQIAAAFMLDSLRESGNSIQIDEVLPSEQDIEEVYKHFSEQIEAQGWTLDSEAIETLTANGTWIKSPEQNLNLIGILSVLDSGDSNYELQFRLSAEGYLQDNTAIFSPFRR